MIESYWLNIFLVVHYLQMQHLRLTHESTFINRSTCTSYDVLACASYFLQIKTLLEEEEVFFNYTAGSLCRLNVPASCLQVSFQVWPSEFVVVRSLQWHMNFWIGVPQCILLEKSFYWMLEHCTFNRVHFELLHFFLPHHKSCEKVELAFVKSDAKGCCHVFCGRLIRRRKEQHLN